MVSPNEALENSMYLFLAPQLRLSSREGSSLPVLRFEDKLDPFLSELDATRSDRGGGELQSWSVFPDRRGCPPPPP
jgi:hypothetical protein